MQRLVAQHRRRVRRADRATRASCATSSPTPTQVFDATARQQEALAETFRIFPTFLDESRATLERLETFSRRTPPAGPRPAPGDPRPAPDAARRARARARPRALFLNLDPLITASKRGLPALRDSARRRRSRCSASCSRSSRSSTRSSSGSSTTSTRPPTSSPTAPARSSTPIAASARRTERGHYLGQFGLDRARSRSSCDPARSADAAATPTSDPTMQTGDETNQAHDPPAAGTAPTRRQRRARRPQKATRTTSDDALVLDQAAARARRRFPQIKKADYSKSAPSALAAPRPRLAARPRRASVRGRRGDGGRAAARRARGRRGAGRPRSVEPLRAPPGPKASIHARSVAAHVGARPRGGRSSIVRRPRSRCIA